MGNNLSQKFNLNNLKTNKVETPNLKYTKFNLYKNEPLNYNNFVSKKYVPILKNISE